MHRQAIFLPIGALALFLFVYICRIYDAKRYNRCLYGSRARGEAKTDSDRDVLILLDKDKVEVQDYDDIAFPFTDLGWELGQAIIPIMYTKKNWSSLSYLPFHKNVEHDKYVIYES